MANVVKDIKEIKRRRILRMAAQLFASRPYHEVNTDDIARNAKIAKGTLYNYFRSKDDLYFAIITEGLDNLLEQFIPGSQPKGHLFLELNRFIVNLYYLLCKNRFIFQVFQKEEWKTQDSRKEVVDKFNALKGILRDLLLRGVSSQQIRPLNVDVAVDLVFGMVQSLVKRYYDGQGERGDVLEVFGLLLEGLVTPVDIDQLKRYSNYLFMNCFFDWNNCFDRVSKRSFFREEIGAKRGLKGSNTEVAV